MQCACAILSYVARPALQYFFPNYPIKSKIVEKNVIEHKMCFDFFYNFSLKHFSFHEEIREILSTGVGLRIKYHLFLSDFIETWTFATDFRKILVHQIPWKSVRCEPNRYMRAGGRTDTDRQTDRHDDTNGRFSQFYEHAKTFYILFIENKQRFLPYTAFSDCFIKRGGECSLRGTDWVFH